MGDRPGSTEAAAEDVVRIRLFAALRERAGWGERSLSLPCRGVPKTPADLWRLLALDDGSDVASGGIPATIRVAINHAFAAADTPLASGDEVAFLPPISGG